MMYNQREKKKPFRIKRRMAKKWSIFQKGRKSVDKAEQLKIRTQTI